ncbi:MAG: response regulator transcription factor [Armatimonadetes bacterium]|nr:response regulator transcription factor [Armatimonadota bacterium]
MTPIKVLLVDDHQVIRKGIRLMLADIPDIEVVGETDNSTETFEMTDRYSPNIILMDIRLSGKDLDGITMTRRIKDEHPNVNVIIISFFDEEEFITEAVKAGASGYLLKDINADDLVRAIRDVHTGGSAIHPEVSRKLLKEFTHLALHLSRKEDQAELSGKEVEVLRLMGQGKSNKEIARTLFITEKTVKAHVSAVLKKLEVRDRTQAVILGIKKGLIK